MTKFIAVVFLAVATFASSTRADEAHHKPAAEASQSAPLSEGEVRKVDKEAKKITLRHGPLANLDMPAMTMVFQVADPVMLDQVKAGDKVRFQAEKIGGGYRITKIQPVN